MSTDFRYKISIVHADGQHEIIDWKATKLGAIVAGETWLANNTNLVDCYIKIRNMMNEKEVIILKHSI